MNRRELREKERDLRKLEEKLRKQQQKLGTEGPSPSRVKWVLRVIYGTVAFVLALVSYYAVARPHISLEPYVALNPVDPYATQFTVKNENSIFKISTVHSVCWPRILQTNHNIGVLSLGPLQNWDHTIPSLEPGESSTVDCPPVMGGIGAWTGEVENAEIEFGVSYRQMLWPWLVVERYAFKAKKDAQHGVHWVHISPTEEKTLLSILGKKGG